MCAPQHIAYIYVYTLRVLPTRRWALICSVIKDLSLIFFGGQTSCDFWCRKQQAAQKRVRGWCGRGKDKKKSTNAFAKQTHDVDANQHNADPAGRSDESDTAGTVQSQHSVQSAPAVNLSRFVHVRLHLGRNINRTLSFCHPFSLLIVVITTAHMLGHARK